MLFMLQTKFAVHYCRVATEQSPIFIGIETHAGIQIDN